MPFSILPSTRSAPAWNSPLYLLISYPDWDGSNVVSGHAPLGWDLLLFVTTPDEWLTVKYAQTNINSCPPGFVNCRSTSRGEGARGGAAACRAPLLRVRRWRQEQLCSPGKKPRCNALLTATTMMMMVVLLMRCRIVGGKRTGGRGEQPCSSPVCPLSQVRVRTWTVMKILQQFFAVSLFTVTARCATPLADPAPLWKMQSNMLRSHIAPRNILYNFACHVMAKNTYVIKILTTYLAVNPFLPLEFHFAVINPSNLHKYFILIHKNC